MGSRASIWYQGESNAGRAYDYRIAFPLLIDDWRRKWQQPHMPFYFCQLPGFGPKKPLPDESEWAELREAQSVALRLPGTGQAVLIDLGESDDAHPRNKLAVGERLARIALANQYGKSLVFSGPQYQSMTIEGSADPRPLQPYRGRSRGATPRGRLRRRQPAREKRPRCFAIAPAAKSKDSRFAGPIAIGRGPTPESKATPSCAAPVVCRGPSRYVTPGPTTPPATWPNGAGLPASPFRSDDFRAITAKNHFGPNQ